MTKNETQPTISLDAELPDFPQGQYLNKAMFLDKIKTFEVVSIALNEFGKVVLELTNPEEEIFGLLSLNKNHLNQLKKILGPVPRQWVGKIVHIKGQLYTPEEGSGMNEGVSLTFA